MSEPIVITGSGAICAAGASPREIYLRLCAGNTSFKPLREWDSSTWPAPLAGGVERIELGAPFHDRKLLKSVQRLRRTDLLGLYAAGQAVQSSGLIGCRATLQEAHQIEFNERTAMYTGCGGAAYFYQYDFLPAVAAAGGDVRRFGQELGASVNPTWLLQSLPNNVLCYLGIAFGFKGANTCITNHGVSGSQAIIEAFYALRGGQADRAIAVGHHSPIDPELILSLYHLGMLTGDAIRPFDRSRSGFILGEGAAAMVLETRSAARARGAEVRGEILGTGFAAEAGAISSARPDREAPARAIQAALAEAAISPKQVAMIVAHGDGTLQSDLAEAAAISRVFGADMPAVTSFKWAFGDTIAASGAIDAAIALRCLHSGTVPGIATLRELDPACHGLNAAASEVKLRGDIALVLNKGFGGMNSALVIKAPRVE
jgi:3-oxoacyl-[acyl-carrier-protein] synthase-1